MVVERLRARKRQTLALTYGRTTITEWATLVPEGQEPIRVLDVGCGVGSDLVGVRDSLAPRTVTLDGTDVYEPSAAKARAAGISVAAVDIEREDARAISASSECSP